MTGLNYIYNNSMEIDLKNPYLKIPVDLCTYAFGNKVLKPFRLYILLTSATQGNIVLTEKDEETISLLLGYKSKKSIKNNFSKLKALGWIGHDQKQNKYWIRGFDELRTKLSIPNRKAVEFGIEYLKDFEEFCFAAVVGKLITYQIWQGRLARMKRGRAFHDLPPKSGYFYFACGYLAKVLKTSKSTIVRCKKKAKEAGYLDIIPSYTTMPIKPQELKSFKANDYELYGKMYIKERRVVEPGPDQIKVFLTYRKRKKLVPI